MMTQNSEAVPINIHGLLTAEGLPRLLAALWQLDLKASTDLAKLNKRFRYAMDESGGKIRFVSGSLLNVKRHAFKTLDKGKKRRPTHYEISGTLEDDDVERVLDADIENVWEPFDGDEIHTLFFDIEEVRDETTHVIIQPSLTPPPRRRD